MGVEGGMLRARAREEALVKVREVRLALGSVSGIAAGALGKHTRSRRVCMRGLGAGMR